MFCPSCGKENPDGAAFCGGCGFSFEKVVPQAAPAPAAPVAAAPVAAAPAAPAPEAPVAPAPVAAAPVAPAPQPQAQPAATAQPAAAAQPQAQPSNAVPFGQHFKNLFQATIHPVTGPAEISGQYSRMGDAILLAIIVVGCLTLIDFSTTLTIVDWGFLYGGYVALVILKSFFFSLIRYAVLTFGCAGFFMLAGLICRSKWSFPKMLSIASMATAPAYLLPALARSYLGLVPYYGVSYILVTAAYAYYFMMLYEGAAAETKLTGNKKGFVLVAVIALTGVIANLF